MWLWRHLCKIILRCFLHTLRHFQSKSLFSFFYETDEYESGNILLHWLLCVSWQFIKELVSLVSGLTDSVNISKQEIKMHLLKQSCNFILLLQVWALYHELCFKGLVPERFTSQVQSCTGCANKQVYYIRKAKHMVLAMWCKFKMYLFGVYCH